MQCLIQGQPLQYLPLSRKISGRKQAEAVICSTSFFMLGVIGVGLRLRSILGISALTLSLWSSISSQVIGTISLEAFVGLSGLGSRALLLAEAKVLQGLQTNPLRRASISFPNLGRVFFRLEPNIEVAVRRHSLQVIVL